MEIIIASNNHNKVKEIQSLLPETILLKSLKDIGFIEEIEETETTFIGNSSLKANYIFNKLNVNVIADDSGLEVEALNNEPGVYSARYAGEKATDDENLNLLLENLSGIKNRKASFVCVITLILDSKEYHFEGKIEGEITLEKKGNDGFGYDPIFIPNGQYKTFAELTQEEKNNFSHRAIALKKMIEFIVKKK